MMREGIPKRRASTRGNSNVVARLGEEIVGGRAKLTQQRNKDAVKMTGIEGQHCGVNGGQE